ncbi:hypothetical protein LTR86_000875 [Recurvomyces mirabilis]|nr:hypothetical protein LTR86_000875 [Recurvomyces mirabilis]
MSTPLNVTGSPDDYVRLLEGDEGLLVALAVTVISILLITLSLKLWLTYKRVAREGVPSSAILTSDAFWLAAHVFGFIYIGTRLSTVSELTDGHQNDLTEDQRRSVASLNEGCQVIFMLTLYLSYASVLCTVLLVRRLPKQLLVYIAPVAVSIIGLLLATLPLIGCRPLSIYLQLRSYCASSPERLLAPIIVLMILEVITSVYWPIFVYRQQLWRAKAGGMTNSRPWPVVPFFLRFLIVGALIAYLDIHFMIHTEAWPYSSTFYCELVAILFSLTATTSISMSKALGKFSFGGMAYTEDPRSRTYGVSGGGGSNSGNRGALSNNQGSQVGQTGQSSSGGKKSVHPRDWAGWGNQSNTVKNYVGSNLNTRGSGESEREILGNTISRRVEIDIQEETTSAKSHMSSL